MNLTSFKSLGTNKTQYLWALIALFAVIIYAPLLMDGGIITDDWGDIKITWNCKGFISCYKEWFPLFSNRPLAPLPLTLSTKLFAMNYFWYLFLNTTIYLLAVVITTNCFSPFLRPLSSAIFFLLAIVPCIALPLIVSPINQLTATLAFLYWALSLKLLLISFRKQRWQLYGLSYLLLLCGFLTYEIILPLLFFTAFLPALLHPQKIIGNWFSYFLKYIAPIIFVLIVVMIWQKLFSPMFFEDNSRFRFNSHLILPSFFTWVNVFISQIPHLFFKSISYASNSMPLIFIYIGMIFLMGNALNSKNQSQHVENRFFIVSILALISSSLIFILTGQSAVSWGYQARGLSSTWFCLSIVIAAFAQLTSSSKNFVRASLLVLIYLFACLSALGFSIQRDKYIESWQLQLHILNDALTLIQKNTDGKNVSVLANVPRYTPNNFNRELVFSQSWDFPAALVLYAQDQVRGGIVIDSRGKYFQNLRIEGGIAKVDDGGEVDFKNSWLYDFEPNSNQGTLTHLKNSYQLEQLIKQWRK